MKCNIVCMYAMGIFAVLHTILFVFLHKLFFLIFNWPDRLPAKVVLWNHWDIFVLLGTQWSFLFEFSSKKVDCELDPIPPGGPPEFIKYLYIRKPYMLSFKIVENLCSKNPLFFSVRMVFIFN